MQAAGVSAETRWPEAPAVGSPRWSPLSARSNVLAAVQFPPIQRPPGPGRSLPSQAGTLAWLGRGSVGVKLWASGFHRVWLGDPGRKGEGRAASAGSIPTPADPLARTASPLGGPLWRWCWTQARPPAPVKMPQEAELSNPRGPHTGGEGGQGLTVAPPLWARPLPLAHRPPCSGSPSRSRPDRSPAAHLGGLSSPRAASSSPRGLVSVTFSQADLGCQENRTSLCLYMEVENLIKHQEKHFQFLN